MYASVVRSPCASHLKIGWYLKQKNTAGKVLLIWGKWVVEKIDPGVGVWGGFQCHVY